MNTTALRHFIEISPELSPQVRLGRYAIVLGLLLLPALADESLRLLYFETLAEAYIAVTVFVSLTLLIFYGLESYLKIDTERFLAEHQRYQIPIAAVLGALPGCGGAIMVMTQYSVGRLGFAAMVATLTSTMGDAAFLLFAREPVTGLAIMVISVIVGSLSGFVVQLIHGSDFLKVDRVKASRKKVKPYAFGKLNWPWIAVLVPGTFLGILSAFQVNTNALWGLQNVVLSIGVVGAGLSVLLWFINPSTSASFMNRTEKATMGAVLDKTTTDTCFVTVWVILAFLLFEMTIHLTRWDLRTAFESTRAFAPLIGVLIGFLPGCGPQVLTTGLYLQGIIPLSAQLGNAISNDGDALFPALAVAPRASIIATLYTAVPALILAYGYQYFFEM